MFGAQINNFSQTLQKHRTQQRYDVAGYLQVLRYDGVTQGLFLLFFFTLLLLLWLTISLFYMFYYRFSSN
jgi:hypothetical protein